MSVTDLALVMDGYPAAFEHGFAVPFEVFLEPRNDRGGFWFGARRSDVVVGEGEIERVLSWKKSSWSVSDSGLRVWVVVAAIIGFPFGVPTTFMIGNGIVMGGGLSDPKHGGKDVVSPAERRRLAKSVEAAGVRKGRRFDPGAFEVRKYVG